MLLILLWNNLSNDGIDSIGSVLGTLSTSFSNFACNCGNNLTKSSCSFCEISCSLCSSFLNTFGSTWNSSACLVSLSFNPSSSFFKEIVISRKFTHLNVILSKLRVLLGKEFSDNIPNIKPSLSQVFLNDVVSCSLL